ncbi:hypothetical protein CTEN210_09829 [Chaetoceros tenuissimus]|uniref:Uncharacterized protein n=1 Tax=Chaetoceros tenuissimus TaxID=426638 RepID=A0AAD3CWL9_9STRA|nr:hypothetical protein CTEN210_09829 [Chaetoceros tenuissimus]
MKIEHFDEINFIPAEGCTDASDYLVRSFVARLKNGFKVKKYGRSKYCRRGGKERILCLHDDGISLTFKGTHGENTIGNLPQLDLRRCKEVRLGKSVDPLHPECFGTPLLRQKCEHEAELQKSFSLIFPHRTLDITASDPDQYTVLIHGFSALCYRIQLATLSLEKARKEKEQEEKALKRELRMKKLPSQVICSKEEVDELTVGSSGSEGTPVQVEKSVVDNEVVDSYQYKFCGINNIMCNIFSS